MARIRIATRGGLIRSAILGVSFAGLLGVSYALMLRMPGTSYRGPLPPLDAEALRIRDAAREAVEALAVRIGERNVFRGDTLEAAALWVEGALSAAGLEVRRESFPAGGKTCRNLIAEIEGTERPGEIVLVGAHYDTAPATPGANDNASGVAALVEIGRILRAERLRRTLRLVAFANEEPPFFRTEEMGSLVHARAARIRGDAIVAMMALETIGYYRDEPGSQSYPPPFHLLYPDRGDFIGFIGNVSSRAVLRQAIRSFRAHARFPSEGAALFGFMTGIGLSDHWSFWQVGYPGIMVTDTAPFRYPYYHTRQDTIDKIDFDRLARVIAGLARVVADLANGDLGSPSSPRSR